MKFHLIGIGGAGMSVVAELLAAHASVAGSDARQSKVLDRLSAKGIKVYVGHHEDNLDPEAVVVLSSAIKDSNPELAVARRRGQRILHRSQALALAAEGRDFVAIAGAHGKTTTSAMIAVALRTVGADPSWAIGGTVSGLGSGGHTGEGSVFVAEADESDASFLNYTPRVELVTNVEADHLDHYGSVEAFEEAFTEFARRMVSGGLLVACADDDGALRMAHRAAAQGLRVATYGTKKLQVNGSDSQACSFADSEPEFADSELEVEKRDSFFLDTPGERRDSQGISDIEKHVVVGGYELTPGGCRGFVEDSEGTVVLELSVVGEHNLLNAAGAWIVGVELGVGREEMARALHEFSGTGRRFEQRGKVGDITVVDDYAHHPTEVAATLRTAQAVAGQGKVRVLFQPHLYSRTREFAEQFAQALSLAQDVVVTSVYGAREDPIPGVEGNIITSRMESGEFVADKYEAARVIASRAQPGDVVMTVGAGDVTELAPLILQELDKA